MKLKEIEKLFIKQEEFSKKVNFYTDLYLKIWKKSNSSKDILNKYHRYNNKKEIELIINKLENLIEKTLNTDNPSKNVINEIKQNSINLINSCRFNFPDDFLNDISKSTKTFIKNVYNKLPNTKYHEIYQALRNVWIMNTLQYFKKIDVKCTDSIFAYSMMYPLTDNPMDNDSNCFIKKKLIKKRKLKFINKLKRNLLTPNIKNNSKINKMLSIIDSVYPHKDFFILWNSLYSIYNGQIKSLFMQYIHDLSKDKINSISFEKGGTSVLADAYLIKPNSSEAFLIFSFGFGIILQIVDDIQDMLEDHKNNHLSTTTYLYKKNNKKYEMENFILKFLNFSYYCLIEYFPNNLGFKDKHYKKVFNWILQSCYFIVFQNVLKNQQLYSKEFLTQIEQRLPITKNKYKSLQKKINSLKNNTNNKILSKKANSEITLFVLSFLDKLS